MQQPPSPYQLSAASIDWGDDNVPRSAAYGDVYYSREHGLAESRHVFLHNNDLPQRFAALPAHTLFLVAETGFGTGLNFLATWQAWRAHAAATDGVRLQYVSVEKHPLHAEDLAKALSCWPELDELTTLLQCNYPPLLPGHHRLVLDNGAVILDLLFGEAQACLDALRPTRHPLFCEAGKKVDAWYLDGFAPDRNPGMWDEALLDSIAALSGPGTQLATFTAAGFVRRGLQQRGFDMEKVAGFGRKRDMLRGRWQAREPRPEPRRRDRENATWHLHRQPAKPVRSVAVIGAGLAGCHSAHALAQRGLDVTVLDAEEHIASGASGNPQGILYTKLSHQDGHLNRFALSSFLFASRLYRSWSRLPGDFCGVLQLLPEDDENETFQRLAETFKDQGDWCQFLDPKGASAVAGLSLTRPAVYYRQAGWLRPAAVCEALLAHERISLQCGKRVIALEPEGEQWLLHTADGSQTRADAVVVANSHAAGALPQLGQLPLKAIRGQLSLLRAEQFETLPRTVICHEGYLAPPVDDMMVIGASYDTRAIDTTCRAKDDVANLHKLQQALPALGIGPDTPVRDARAALRCTTPDYLPMVGPAPIATAQQQVYARLASDARARIDGEPAVYPGLFVNLAHGSRGLSSTPLAAQLLAAQVCNESPPLPRDLVRALSPSRFLIRSLMRGR